MGWTERIRTGDIEPIEVYVTNRRSEPLTGLTSIYVRIRRVSDGYYLDWNDSTFKNVGWTTLDKLTSEVDATNFPGLYEVTGGLDTSAITNPAADDDYQVLPLENPVDEAVLPSPGLIRIGRWVDQIDTIWDKLPTNNIMGSAVKSDKDDEIDAILSDTNAILLDTSAIDARLPTDPADESNQLAQHSATQAAIAALNDLDIADVQTALTNQGYTAGRAVNLDYLDADISSRATPGEAMSLTGAERITLTDTIWDELLSGHTLAGSAGKTLADAAIPPPSAGAIAAEVWDTLRSAHTVVGSFGESVRLDGAGLDVSAANEVRDAILSDSTPFAGANIDATISSRAEPGEAMDLLAGSVDANALDVTAAYEIAAAVWDITASLHNGAGSMGQLQNRLDATISSRAAPGAAMTLAANAVNATALAADAVTEIVTGVWDALLASYTDPGSTGEAIGRLDVAVSTRAAPGADMGLTTGAIDGVADQVWEELLAGHTTLGSAGEAQARLDVAVSTRAAPGAAMDLVSDAVDATSLADSARDKIVDQVWEETLADHSGTVGSTAEALASVTAPAAPAVVAAAVWDRLLSLHTIPGSAGVTLAGRAAPGDAMDLITDAVDAAALATSGVNEIRDSILSDSTPFAGANIDAAISSRAVAGDAMALTAPAEAALVDAVWDENIQTAHGGAYTSGLALRVLGVDISQRTNNPSLNSLLGVPDVVGWDIEEEINAKLGSVHGTGSWEGTDWSTVEKQQIRGALGIVGTQATPAGGGDLQDILADTAAMDARLPLDPADESNQLAAHGVTQAAIAALNDLDQTGVQAALTSQGYTPARAVKLDQLDAAVSSRSSHSAADVDTQLTATHGAGSWETGGWDAAEKEQLRDALGIDGVKTTAVDGQLQDLIARVG